MYSLCNLIVLGVILGRELVFYNNYIDWSYEDHLIRGELIVFGSRIHQSKGRRRLFLRNSNVLASHIIMGNISCVCNIRHRQVFLQCCQKQLLMSQSRSIFNFLPHSSTTEAFYCRVSYENNKVKVKFYCIFPRRF